MAKEVYIICGPTASGKTAVSVELSKKLNGEVISADSMQIYDELFIGTARPNEQEMAGIPHHLMGYVRPDGDYSVALYKQAATKCIDELIYAQKTPIVCGGTGLYINSLTYDLDFSGTGADEQLREELSRRFDENPAALYNELIEIDPQSKARIHANDKKRIIRRLEILKSGQSSDYDFDSKSQKYDFKIFVLSPERSVLYERINSRVDKMMSDGLEAEARALYYKYGGDIKAFAAIGYKEFIPYFNGLISLEDVVYQIKLNTRHYAKRQLTWFKRDERARFIDPLAFENAEKCAEKIIEIAEEHDGH